jgi:predicted anti-sigma-YlaC factor YlaD
MDCKKIEGLLTEHIDGELNNGLRRGVEEHLQSCYNCRQLKEMLVESSIEPLKGAQRVNAPEDLWQKIKDKIEERTPTGSIPDLVLERLLLPMRARRPAIALAAAVVILLLAITIIRLPMEKPSAIATYMEEQADFFIYLADENGAGSAADLTNIGTDIEEYLL